jgi:hypothetical protein
MPALNRQGPGTGPRAITMWQPPQTCCGAAYPARRYANSSEDGILERILDGAYRFVGAPHDELARCVAACAHPAKLVVEGPAAVGCGGSVGCRTTPSCTSSRHRQATPASSRG